MMPPPSAGVAFSRQRSRGTGRHLSHRASYRKASPTRRSRTTVTTVCCSASKRRFWKTVSGAPRPAAWRTTSAAEDGVDGERLVDDAHEPGVGDGAGLRGVGPARRGEDDDVEVRHREQLLEAGHHLHARMVVARRLRALRRSSSTRPRR